MYIDLDTCLFSFIIPILPAILNGRLRVPPSLVQFLTSAVLSMNALVSIVIVPITGYLADKVYWKNSLMISCWVVNILGTAITAWSATFTSMITFINRYLMAGNHSNRTFHRTTYPNICGIVHMDRWHGHSRG